MPLLSQPPARGREIKHPEPSAPSWSLAILPEYADVRSRELSFQLRTWPWTWPVLSINEGDNFWPEAKVLALDGFFRPAGLHWTSNQVQCHFCAVRVDDWEPRDNINEVHVRFTLGRVGAAGYGTRHSQGCLFALHRREHARWQAGLDPTPPRQAQTGLYRNPGREVSHRGPPSWAREPWWERAGMSRDVSPDQICFPEDVVVVL